MLCAGRTLSHLRVSSNGRFFAFLASDLAGTKLVVLPTDNRGSGPELVVGCDPAPSRAHPHGGGVFDWIGDSSGLIYIAGNGNLYRVSLDGGPGELILDSTLAGFGEGCSLSTPMVSPSGDWIALTIDDRVVVILSWDGKAISEMKVISSQGDRGQGDRGQGDRGSGCCIPDFVMDPFWYRDGSLLGWTQWNNPSMVWDESQIIVRRIDCLSEDIIVLSRPEVSYTQGRFSPDGRYLGYISDESGWPQLWVSELSYDFPASNTGLIGSMRVSDQEGEHAEPAWGPGQRSFEWYGEGSEAISFLRNYQGDWSVNKVSLADPRQEIRIADGFLASLGTFGTYIVGISARDGVIAIEADQGEPTSEYACSASRYSRSLRSIVARSHVAGMPYELFDMVQQLTWESDGAQIHGRLILPEPDGASVQEGFAKPPVLVWIHGGPMGQQNAEFNFRMAYFLERGWAIFLPDFRGSSGWGREYSRSLKGGWGVVDIDDIASGMTYLASLGICDSRFFVPIGGSSGGTAVLLVMAEYPELCAGGISLYPVSDFVDLSKSTHRLERCYNDFLIGPLSEFEDRYEVRSPLNNASKISAPVLIMHGERDKVVPVSQSRRLVEILEGIGTRCVVKFYQDEGHGWSSLTTTLDELETTEDFLKSIIGLG